MPAIPVVLAFLKGGLGWLWDFLSSHFGQLVAVALVAWFWSAHRANERCATRITEDQAAAVAAAQAETVRQADAAREIAAAATDRLVEEQALAADLRVQIEALDKEEEADAPPPKPSCTPAVVRPCRVDDRFADRLRRLDAAAARRPARAAPGAR